MATTTVENKKKSIWRTTVYEWQLCWNDLRETKCSSSLLFAIFCVLAVVVGNVILLISLNFWLSIFPKEDMASNSSQIAVQVIVSTFLVMCFTVVGIIYLTVFGYRSLVRALTDPNRTGNPWYRFFLLFASGATNAVTGVLAVYAMSHIPEFLQAVLLSIIPFTAQVWTCLLVPEERKRRYCSLTFVFSFIFVIAGVLLSSLSSFLHTNETGRVAPVGWVFVYLASAVVFGLWCVVQRLYLDAMMFRPEEARSHSNGNASGNGVAEHMNFTTPMNTTDEVVKVNECESRKAENNQLSAHNEPLHAESYGDEDAPPKEPLLASRRVWGKQNEDDLAAKMVLLLVGICFQALVSFACLPVDVIPWFGTSSSVKEAWHGFRASCDFIFASWIDVRYGMLHTLGFFMSFVGCAYLNERSPTLASVVMQIAGPITSLVLIILPQWDVYGTHGVLSHKIIGVILLLIAGLMYHVWDQASLRELMSKSQAS